MNTKQVEIESLLTALGCVLVLILALVPITVWAFFGFKWGLVILIILLVQFAIIFANQYRKKMNHESNNRRRY